MGFFAYDSFCMHMGGHADGINWGGRGEAARDRSSLVGGSVGGRKRPSEVVKRGYADCLGALLRAGLTSTHG